MKKNLFKKFWKKNKAVSVIILLVLLFGLPVVAYNSFDDRVIDRIADKYLKNVEEMAEDVFGAITQDKSRYQYGISIEGGGLDISAGTLSWSGITGDMDLSGVTTTIPMLDAIQIPLNMQTATSEGGSSNPHTITVVGSLENTGSDLLCDTQGTWIDIYTAMGYAYGLKMGTSTSATSTEAHLITEITTDNEIGTTTTDILTKTDDEGSETEETWVWNNSEHVVITRTFQVINASTSELVAAGTGAATAHLNCRNRY